MQHHHQIVLAKIRCEASKATLDAILFEFGLHARECDEPNLFDLMTCARGAAPEVDGDLTELAVAGLHRAEREGALPSVSVLADS